MKHSRILLFGLFILSILIMPLTGVLAADICDRDVCDVPDVPDDDPVVVIVEEVAEDAPPAINVFLVDPDGVLPDGYPMENFTDGGTFWYSAGIWHNDVFDMIGFHVYLPQVQDAFDGGFAQVIDSGGNIHCIQLLPGPASNDQHYAKFVVC